MEQGSSDRNQGNRGRSSSQNRNRSGSRSRNGGSRNEGSRGDSGDANRGQRNRDRKPAPKPSGWQKFVKAITFGLVDPFESEQQKKRAARKTARKKPLSVEPTGPRLYVGNLDFGVTEAELESTFAKIGTVKEALVVKQGGTGRSKGFGFVEMSSLEEAKEAVRKLNDTDLNGRSMLVTGAKSEKPEGKERGEWKPSGERRGSDGESGDRPRRSSDRRDSGSRGERSERGRRPARERSGEKESRTVTPREVAVVESAFVTLSKLNAEATEEDVHDLFDGIGVIQHRGDQISDSGTLVVELGSQEEAQKAVSLLDRKSFMGGQITVGETPESERSDLRAPAAFEPAVVANPAPVSAEPETEPAPSEEGAADTEESVATAEDSPAPEEPASAPEEAAPAAEEAAPTPEDLPVTAEAPLEEKVEVAAETPAETEEETTDSEPVSSETAEESTKSDETEEKPQG